MPDADTTIRLLRRLLLGLLLLGLLGIGAELVLMRHYEDLWQWIPLIVMALALATIGWHLISQSGASVRALQFVMSLFVAAGGLGVVLHYRASLGFQLESGSAPSGWPLFVKVIHSKVPPALAPGALAQLGLLGLAYAFRHPALSRSSSQSTETQIR